MAGMKSRRRLWFIAVPIALLMLIPAVLLAAERPTAAASTLLTIFTGAASVAHSSGDFTIANDGETLANGDRVRTDDAGHALVTFFDGSTLELEPSTTVQIDTAGSNADGSIAIQLTQTLGRTWASVQKLTKPDSKFEIKTPASTAAVRGTAFLTQVLANGDTTVQTSDGTVAVTAQGQTVLVTVGQTTNVRGNQPPTPPSATPPPANTLRFGMHSPAHILIVDPLGRSCGIAMPGATIVRHIPGCLVSDPGSEPETVDVPNAIAGTYRTVISEIAPGGTFTLSATGLDGAGDTSFDLSERGDGQSGTVFGSSLDVQVGTDGQLTASELAPLALLQGASPSPSPSPSASATASASPSPTQSFVPNLPLPSLPVSTATPTASPTPVVTPTPSPSPTQFTPPPTPAATTPIPGCTPSTNQPKKCG